jgi:hypothetical protein
MDIVKNNKLVVGFIIASIIAKISIVTLVVKSANPDIGDVVGSVLAYLLFPLGGAYLLGWMYERLFFKEFSDISFKWIYAGLWISTVVANSITIDPNQAKNSLVSSNEFKYSPKDCLFEVTFQEKPKISEISSTDGKSILYAEVAELTSAKDRAYMKTEYIRVGQDTLKNFTPELIYEMAKNYSLSNGIENPEIKQSETKFGKEISLRGFKKLKDSNNTDRYLTLYSHWFFKGDNVFILYAGSESKDYPTSGIALFLSSLKLKN